MNCRKLIKSVEKNPELYDYYDIKYSNQKYREIAWAKVSEEVRQPAQACKKKWLGLRDTYRRVLRKRKDILTNDPTARPRKWAYEDDIRFLLPHFHDRVPTKSSDVKFEDVEIEENELRDDQNSLVDETPENFIVTHFDDNETKEMPSISTNNSDVVTNSVIQEENNTNRVSESLIKFLLKELEDKTKTIKELEDKAKTNVANANEDFFIAIAKTVNSLTTINQNVVKSKIFSVVSEMELKELTEKQTVSGIDGDQTFHFINIQQPNT